MRIKLALSTLCEDPGRRTGLSTLFPEFVAAARRIFPEVSWLVFVGKGDSWNGTDVGVEVCRRFSSNEDRTRRLLDDHLHVASEARARGARALLTVGFLPLRSAGLPVAMHVFAVDRMDRGSGLRSVYRRWAVSRGLDKAFLVIANSAWTAAQLRHGNAEVMVSPEGIRHDHFNAEGPSGARGVTGRYLLWASNLYTYKRVELALSAYAGLPARLRSEFPFVLAGGDWEGGRSRAEAEASRLGITDNVRFLGWVSDAELPALYRGAQAHILSTSRETFGRSVLEAMACGCPSVLQDLPVLREVAAESAYYVDFTRAGEATAALERMCVDPSAHLSMRTAGIARSKLFSFERLARERVGAIIQRLEGVKP